MNSTAQMREKNIPDGGCTDELAASSALTLLARYKTTKDGTAKTEAINILDPIAEKIRRQIGDCWCNLSALNSYNVSETAYALAEAYKLLMSMGTEKTLYLEAAQDICGYAVGHQLLDGGINVTPCVTDRFDGVFFIRALVSTYLETEKNFYHVSSVRAFSYYSREFHNEKSILSEKEEGLPLIADALVNGGLALYEYTGYERYTELIKQTCCQN